MESNIYYEIPCIKALLTSSRDGKRERASFTLWQVLTEVYCSLSRGLPLEQHVLVSLVLHKVVDPDPKIRSASRELLEKLDVPASPQQEEMAEDIAEVMIRRHMRAPFYSAFAIFSVSLHPHAEGRGSGGRRHPQRVPEALSDLAFVAPG